MIAPRRRGARPIPWAIASCLVVAGACGPRDLQVLEATRDAGAHDGGSTDAGSYDAGATCTPPAGADLCSAIPELEAPRTLDARGDEFCATQGVLVTADTAAWKLHPDLSFPEVLVVHAGWSIDGVHVDVRVTDPHVVVSASSALAEGDAVEIFVSGSVDLHGPFDGTVDGGALQVIVAPPAAGVPARGTTYFHPAKAVQTEAPLDPSRYAARLTDDGYEVEVFFPWTNPGAPRASGDGIGFDVSLDISDSDTASGRQQEISLGNRPVAGATNCTPDVGPQPFCDDRTWCTPTLR